MPILLGRDVLYLFIRGLVAASTRNRKHYLHASCPRKEIPIRNVVYIIVEGLQVTWRPSMPRTAPLCP